MKPQRQITTPSAEEYRPLQAAVREAREILVRYDEGAWAEKFDEKVASLRGVERILGLHWPGMGGLHDLIICRANGHRISPDREAEVNRRLHALFEVILGECNKLRDAASGPGTTGA